VGLLFKDFSFEPYLYIKGKQVDIATLYAKSKYTRNFCDNLRYNRPVKEGGREGQSKVY
jgi:hypothetical protein